MAIPPARRGPHIEPGGSDCRAREVSGRGIRLSCPWSKPPTRRGPDQAQNSPSGTGTRGARVANLAFSFVKTTPGLAGPCFAAATRVRRRQRPAPPRPPPVAGQARPARAASSSRCATRSPASSAVTRSTRSFSLASSVLIGDGIAKSRPLPSTSMTARCRVACRRAAC